MADFRVVVIGAGETGTPLLQQLLSASFVKVLGVADLNPQQPGIALAQAHGVRVTTDFMELLALGTEVDIVIDVTGVGAVREALRKAMVNTGNRHTILMHENIAMLMMSLSAGKLIQGKHGDTDYT
ncbi:MULTISPECIES: Gfo/Idh/MocA family oxidoreductase [Giesbergeria]|uniref:Oxidoreductase n=1 Tax=Giesbergeria sinuosa TaxID=80883 RepID=A0ABV9QB33_9BURK